MKSFCLADYVHVDSRVNSVLPVRELKFSNYDNIVLCGPNPMIFNAANEALNQGVKPESIHLIMESIFKCFNGLCGACDCGGIKLCKEGPVITLNRLIELKQFVIRNHSGTIKDEPYVYGLMERMK